ncbi:MAG: flagellar hook assembly protein FlgD [Rhodobiaceae bacterium]|nr:flagellar hook assembly protein FlgD [Rhodobiaceae bacterium]MCC0057454.1 flagellar hook assembly protein FlgD [Rhodobiaceae bacterium]
MYLDALSGLSQSSSAATDRQGIADNFDTFLQLLTTQLRNQNPLDPLDTNEFTQQLVQFSSVEQAIKTNANLENMVKLSAASTATAAVGFIGKSIDVQTSASHYDGTSAKWTYTAASDAPSTTFTVRNAAGSVVYSETKSVNQGTGSFVWNGTTLDGSDASAGTYSLTVDARDADGKSVYGTVSTSGVVEAIDFDGDEPYLIVDGISIPMSAVKRVNI